MQIMASEQLHITLIQPDVVWEDKFANLQQYEQTIGSITGPKQVVVLPEMFSTGFSMDPERLAEPMDGPTVTWMVNMAAKCRCILAGSLIVGEVGNYYNRLLWVQPDGRIGFYDKRHLFTYATEDEHYTPGQTRMIAQVNGWRINLMICYDLRFPVWSRNQDDEYDVLLYVANWPEKRSIAWNTLLRARAIENMCYVVGVNRVGSDAKGHNYIGDSSVYSPLGETILHMHNEAGYKTVTLEMETLKSTRSSLPFLNDADKFMLL